MVAPREEVYEHILSMKESLTQFNLAVEFRNRSWFRGERQDRLLQWLKDHSLVHVCPGGFSSSVPPVAAATADLAYIRFHGRNKDTWEAPGQTSTTRFDWYYRAEELEEWVPRVRALKEQAREVHILFNTNNRDQGPHNAIRMGRLLEEGLTDNEEAIIAAEASLGISAPARFEPTELPAAPASKTGQLAVERKGRPRYPPDCLLQDARRHQAQELLVGHS